MHVKLGTKCKNPKAKGQPGFHGSRPQRTEPLGWQMLRLYEFNQRTPVKSWRAGYGVEEEAKGTWAGLRPLSPVASKGSKALGLGIGWEGDGRPAFIFPLHPLAPLLPPRGSAALRQAPGTTSEPCPALEPRVHRMRWPLPCLFLHTDRAPS